MIRNAIDQTELVVTNLSLIDNFKITSPVITEENMRSAIDKHGESNIPAEVTVEGYRWYLVDKLDGTEEHTAACLGSTWVGIKAA